MYVVWARIDYRNCLLWMMRKSYHTIPRKVHNNVLCWKVNQDTTSAPLFHLCKQWEFLSSATVSHHCVPAHHFESVYYCLFSENWSYRQYLRGGWAMMMRCSMVGWYACSDNLAHPRSVGDFIIPNRCLMKSKQHQQSQSWCLMQLI